MAKSFQSESRTSDFYLTRRSTSICSPRSRGPKTRSFAQMLTLAEYAEYSLVPQRAHDAAAVGRTMTAHFGRSL
jgi:hypothetical protein